MKKFAYLFAFLFATLSFSLVSCDDDEDEVVDLRDQAVASYNATMNVYLCDNGKLESIAENQAIDVVKVEKSGASDLLIDGDIKCVNIREASNGFTFDVPEQVADGKHYSGFDGVQLGDMKYNGMYDAKGSMSFYYKVPIEDFSEELIELLDEEDLKKLLEILEIADENDLDEIDATVSARFQIVIELDLTKKL